MPPRRRRAEDRRRLNEAARLTTVFLNAGFSKADVGRVLGRNPSLVSQFFTHNKGASYVEALRAAVQEFQVGEATTVEQLRAVAQPHVKRRTTAAGSKARVRTRGSVTATREGKWASGLARAGAQHIASGASTLKPVIVSAAGEDGELAFTVRARRSAFLMASGDPNDSPGVKRHVVQRSDGTEERQYGLGAAGFSAQEWETRVAAAGDDVAGAVHSWLVETGRLAPGARLTNLEIRAWVPAGDRRPAGSESGEVTHQQILPGEESH